MLWYEMISELETGSSPPEIGPSGPGSVESAEAREGSTRTVGLVSTTVSMANVIGEVRTEKV